MAGGPSTPALAAAVAAAGGYGFVAGGYLTAGHLHAEIAATRLLTDAPFGVNLFMPSKPTDPAVVMRYATSLAPDAERLGVPLGQPQWEDDAYHEKLEVVASTHVDLVSFTFGCPSSAAVDRLHRAGAQVAVTVTSVSEAAVAEAVGADLLAVQGTEAGGHQGGFLASAPNERPLRSLLAEVGEATTVPRIGAGGVMDGSGMAAVLRTGAVAVQIGTALLCATESGTSPTYRRALLGATYPETMITRAFSGRYARGLANEFARAHHLDAPQAYPEVHHLTRPLRAAATEAGDPSVPNLWAGTGWRQVTSEPAGAILGRMAAVARRESA
jgi:nitronate monooxygenase